MLRKSISDMQILASQRGGKCLSKVYLGARTPILWQCGLGHEWMASPVSITSRNSWCPYCAGQRTERASIAYMKKFAQDRGGDCLSLDYVNSKTKLLWSCSRNHTWEAIPLNIINKGSWCPVCFKEKHIKSKIVLEKPRAKKPVGYWNNLENCKSEAQKYITKNEWQKSSSVSYSWACKNSWLNECTSHMKSERKPNRYWTLELCKEEAIKYKTKVEWRLSNRASFSKANKEGWLAVCCEHMEKGTKWFGPSSIMEFLVSYDINFIEEHRFKGSPEVERRPFDFYLADFNLVIEFHGEQHLTGWGRRAEDAQGIQKRDLIKKNWAITNGLEYLEIKQWEVNSKEDIHEQLLDKLISIAKNTNKQISFVKSDLTDIELQKVTSKLKWTLEACMEEAKKYNTRKEWQTLGASSYNAAHKKKWLDKCCTHMKAQLAPKGYWTLERCIEDAKQYQRLDDWSKAKPSGYFVARSKNWVSTCTPHMTDGRKISSKIIWTHEKCIELAKQCNSRAEFKKRSGSAYLRARVNGWLDECCSHMTVNSDLT